MSDVWPVALAMWAACTAAYLPAAWLLCRRARRRAFREGLRVRAEGWLRAHEALRDMGWEVGRR